MFFLHHWFAQNKLECLSLAWIYYLLRLLKFCYVLTASATVLALFFFSFLLQPLPALMRQTRQAVCSINQSIFLRCLWSLVIFGFYLWVRLQPTHVELLSVPCRAGRLLTLLTNIMLDNISMDKHSSFFVRLSVMMKKIWYKN